MRLVFTVVACAAFVCLASCSPPMAEADAGSIDAGTDAGTDAGESTDAGDDAGVTVDSGTPDSGVPDAGTPDAGASDGGIPAGALTYLEDVHPMFEAAGCSTFGCHGGVIAGAGVLVYMPDALTSWLDMVNRASARDAGVIVVPFQASRSVLVTHSEGELVAAGVLTTSAAQRVRRWVDDGAYYSRAATPDAGGLFPSDGGATATACSLVDGRGTPSLPAPCMPRCSAATWAEVVACRSQPDVAACQNAAIAADATPTVELVGGAETVGIDCSTCLDLQTRSCIDEHCRFELLALDRCSVFTIGACTAQSQAVSRCASTPAFISCQRARDALCVAP